MSLHDKIAFKARLDGDTSQQFRVAAQKHANVTWVYLIVAGVVWYFSSWAWSLIPFMLAAFTAFKSISATMVATRLEKQETSTG
jgi:membrane protein YdbS with pleckstrin-like domain